MKPDKYYSASQLSMFLGRYDQWKTSYIDGQKPPTSREQAIGKVVHSAVHAYWLDNEPPLQRFMSAFEEEKLNIPEEDLGNQMRIGLSLLDAYLESPLSQMHMWPGTPAKCTEWEFTAPIPGLDVPLYGIIDLVTQDENRNPCLRDLKTAAKAQSLNACIKSVQRVVYQYAFRAVTGLDAPFVFDYVLKPPDGRIICRECPVASDDEIDKMLEDLKKMDEEVRGYGGMFSWKK